MAIYLISIFVLSICKMHISRRLLSIFLMAKLYYFVFLVLTFITIFMVYLGDAANNNDADYQALISFRNLITNANTTMLGSNWSTDSSFCTWIGVTCSSRRQRVTALNLHNMNFQGPISTSIANLSFLVELDLANNSFHGSLPDGLGHLTRLKAIKVDSNHLEGSIPLSLFKNQKLRRISLANNQFSGEMWIESWSLPQLRFLELTGNSFTGTIHPCIANVSNLQILYLDKNRIGGEIPEEIGNMSNLIALDFSNNQFTGTVPPPIFNTSSLREAFLTSNSLSGPFLLYEGNGFLELEKISLSDNQLAGEIPSTLCQFVNLRSLYLSWNNFTGAIPRNFGCLAKLETFYVIDNQITGTIPASLGNISTLQFLACYINHIGGNVPKELANLSNLQILVFDSNNLIGEIPEAIYNMSSLVILGLVDNRLSGRIPETAGLHLPNLEEFYLGKNLLVGEIPLSISNVSKLVKLELSHNFFTGTVPINLGYLRELEWVNLASNQLTNQPGKRDLEFMNSLVECRKLQFLALGNNPLAGSLPDSFGNLSSSVEMLSIENAQINGHIPRRIGNMSGMLTLLLYGNNLIGSVPSEIGQLKKLQRLFLNTNRLQGHLPEELCKLNGLGDLLLFENQLSGMLPDCIGNLSRLQRIFLGSNNFSLSIPLSLWEVKNLLVLNLSQNSLQGELAQGIGELESLDELDLSGNKFSGIIPVTLGNLRSLRQLSLSNNSLEGPIPSSFGNLLNLETLDLSSNTLTSSIPESLQNLRHLREIDLSYNHLEGKIPSGGVFANSSPQYFIGNKDFCSMPTLQVPPCTNNTHLQGSRSKNHDVLKIVIPVISTVTLAVVLVSFWIAYRRKQAKPMDPEESVQMTRHQRISHQDIQRATDKFSASNLLGEGSSGSVYKGILSSGEVVAVKVLNLQDPESRKRFDAECEVMRQIRHRNLVKVISTCAHEGIQAIVLEYMSNGNLDLWLHGHNCYLDLLQRVHIMLDVAIAIEYLHHGFGNPIIYCDLKPANILLDQDMVAHVSDFGISKILAQNRPSTLTKTLGTIGYIAPEYGLGGIVSTKGDVYSFGIMLLESITGKKPTEETFDENVSFRQWVKASYPNAIMEIIDRSLLQQEESCICSIVELAFDCSNEAPEERPNMKDIVVRLTKIKSGSC